MIQCVVYILSDSMNRDVDKEVRVLQRVLDYGARHFLKDEFVDPFLAQYNAQRIGKKSSGINDIIALDLQTRISSQRIHLD